MFVQLVNQIWVLVHIGAGSGSSCVFGSSLGEKCRVSYSYRSYRTTIGAIGAIGAIGTFQIVDEHGAAAFHYRSYRRGHYRTIGEGTIGLSELSEYYRSAIGVYYRNYRTGAQLATGSRMEGVM